MKTSPARIKFHFLLAAPEFKDRRRTKQLLLRLAQQESKSVAQINYIFCSDDYLLDINKKYLNHDSFTDIITFDLSTEGEPIIADIYISIERVRGNAATYKCHPQQELLRVMIHGILHLCGYKDKTKADKKLMRHKESYYMNLLAVPRETGARRI